MLGKIQVTPFVKRQFDIKASGTKITDITPEEFEKQINDSVKLHGQPHVRSAVRILNGYAPFCKLVVLPNFTSAKVGSMKIELGNYQYLRHGYSARNEKELAVLTRWFELPLPAPKAEWLVVILYSREQCFKEWEAERAKEIKHWETTRGKTLSETDKEAINSIEGVNFYLDDDVAYGIIAVLGQSGPDEEPMQPITMMRNALGVDEGGSGVKLDHDKYKASVEFWSQHAIVKS